MSIRVTQDLTPQRPLNSVAPNWRWSNIASLDVKHHPPAVDVGYLQPTRRTPVAYESPRSKDRCSCAHLDKQAHAVGGLRGVHLGQRQVWVVLHIEPRWSSFYPAQHEMTHCIEADRAQLQGIFDGVRYFGEIEGLHQP